jgi:glycerol-3-phosphate dehydrogenase
VDRYLAGVKVRRSDVLSAWTGIRPLVKDPAAKNTESVARTHVVHTDPDTGLVCYRLFLILVARRHRPSSR